MIKGARSLAALSVLAIASGCATRCIQPANDRAFSFARDSFAYSNEVFFENIYDSAGEVREKRKNDADYALRCFVMARSARQFFQYVTFDPSLPQTDDETYRNLIEEAIHRDPMYCEPTTNRVVIPGFTNLFHFSSVKTKLLQDTCGSQWKSYFQRGHWRMLLPFSGSRRAREARMLALEAKNNRPPVVHVVSTPKLDINHAVLLFGVRETLDAFQFQTYDPNNALQPLTLTFDRRKRRFIFPRTHSYSGGRVNVYEIYRAKHY